MMKKLPLLIVAAFATAASGPVLAADNQYAQQIYIDKYDQNNDGKVTAAEFQAARRASFDLTDEDRSGDVDESEYVQEYANRLDRKIASERKAHIKQTHIRFNSLDKDENKQIEWTEYQASGEYSFNRYDTNKDDVINDADAAPKNTWEQSPNGVNGAEDKPDEDKTKASKQRLSSQEREKIKKKNSQRVIYMPTTHNLKGMLDKYDSNEDGVITKEEFTAVRRGDFDKTDDNGDGWLSEDEYVLEYVNRLDSKIETMRKKQLKQAVIRFDVLDKNENKAMTFEEYQISGMKSFARYDGNKDGVVSAADPKPKGGVHHGVKNTGKDKG